MLVTSANFRESRTKKSLVLCMDLSISLIIALKSLTIKKKKCCISHAFQYDSSINSIAMVDDINYGNDWNRIFIFQSTQNQWFFFIVIDSSCMLIEPYLANKIKWFKCNPRLELQKNETEKKKTQSLELWDFVFFFKYFRWNILLCAAHDMILMCHLHKL